VASIISILFILICFFKIGYEILYMSCTYTHVHNVYAMVLCKIKMKIMVGSGIFHLIGLNSYVTVVSWY
jgi:hypothetical protein